MQKLLLMVLAVTLCLTASVIAQPISDNFFAEVDQSGNVIEGSGDWYLYDQAPSGEWWNTWFYDHPPDPTRWKEVDLTFCVSPADAVSEVTINWSTVDWGGPGGTGPAGPFPMPGDEMYIERLIDYGIDIPIDPVTGEGAWAGTLPVPYNPEWISIDLRGFDFTITGCIVHDCVPEPATMGLLALGGLAVIRRKRR